MTLDLIIATCFEVLMSVVATLSGVRSETADADSVTTWLRQPYHLARLIGVFEVLANFCNNYNCWRHIVVVNLLMLSYSYYLVDTDLRPYHLAWLIGVFEVLTSVCNIVTLVATLY